MNIDEAIGRLKGIIYASHSAYFKNFELMYQDVDAIETIINEYNNLKQIEESHRIENGKLRKENKIKDEYLDLIQFMAVDYDGERKAKGLMELIDQLADYAVKGINCDTKSEVYFGKNILKENIDSHIPHID